MSDLLEQLRKLHKSDEYPLHMPGHKRNPQMNFTDNPYSIDITEIIGYDDLYQAEGILQEAMKRAAKVCGAEETFFLVNGSTVGILSAITGVTHFGDRILVARNCHKAVFHAMELRQLQAVYLHPNFLEDWDLQGIIRVEEVYEKLEKYPDIKAVVITSPTYDGIVSPVKEIARAAHKAGIPLIVDEAHGAHFPYDDRFPESAIQSGADVVIQSMHKTLSSFTQTALLHMKKGYADTDRIREYIGYYQTSSPSYLFMAGMDFCMSRIEEEGAGHWDCFFKLRGEFLGRMQQLKHIRIYEKNDPCKLVVSVKNTNMTGKELQEKLLQQYHIQVEMAAETYVLGIITFADTREGFDRLGNALLEIDGSMDIARKPCQITVEEDNLDTVKILSKETFFTEDVVYSLSEIREKEKEKVLLEKAENRIAAGYVNVYPPGIPILIPGERIRKEHIWGIRRYLEKELNVQGLTEENIWVCC